MEIRDTAERLIVGNANISGSTFDDVNLSDAVFTNVNLSRTSLTDINLRAAAFREVNLRDVDIQDCALEGMRVDGVLVTDLLAAYRGGSGKSG